MNGRSWKVLLAAVLMATTVRAESDAVVEEPVTLPDWVKKVTLSGDLRLRHEMIDDARMDDTRTRWRLRARLKLAAQVSDTVKAVVRIASGHQDPVSTNQTLDDGFSGKELWLDQAYAAWTPWGKELTIFGGKMSKPWIRVADLVWDSDLNPEGAALTYSKALGGAEMIANAGVFVTDENGRSDSDDRFLYTGQLAAEGGSDTIRLLGGAGLYVYENMQGYSTLFNPLTSFGNSTVEDEEGNLLYATEFTEVELFAEVGTKVRSLPLRFYGQYVVNTEADENDTGYLAGLTLGKAKLSRSWSLGYNYRDIEADAVVGLYNDSDFNGGGTNGKGHKLQAKYAIAKNWVVAGTYFINNKDPNGANTDYDRLQVDLVAKF